MTTATMTDVRAQPDALGYVALHGGDASAVLVPALGGKIRELTLAGRQWLWHNPEIPFVPPPEGAPYDEAGDSGGFDECFPTTAACRLPTRVKGAGDALLPDHGELWTQRPEVAITTDEEGHSATCTWQLARLPFRFRRTVTVRRDGAIVFRYEAGNHGPQRLPFLWSSRPLFPLTPATRITLPAGARTRVCAQTGIDFGGPLAEHQWPRLRHGATLADLSRPEAALPQPYACKLFVELPKAPCLVALDEGTTRLEMHLDGRETPSVGVWINRRAWTPFAVRRSILPWRKAKPYCNLALQPCIGAPDALSDALGAWDSAHWLDAGRSVQWSMTWRGSVIEEK